MTDTPIKRGTAKRLGLDLPPDAAVYDEIDWSKVALSKPVSEPAPKTPCSEGFHWIGQSFQYCDRCGLPAWEHAGIAELPTGAGPFASDRWVLRPFKPGEADRVRAKWEGPATEAILGSGVDTP